MRPNICPIIGRLLGVTNHVRNIASLKKGLFHSEPHEGDNGGFTNTCTRNSRLAARRRHRLHPSKPDHLPHRPRYPLHQPLPSGCFHLPNLRHSTQRLRRLFLFPLAAIRHLFNGAVERSKLSRKSTSVIFQKAEIFF